MAISIIPNFMRNITTAPPAPDRSNDENSSFVCGLLEALIWRQSAELFWITDFTATLSLIPTTLLFPHWAKPKPLCRKITTTIWGGDLFWRISLARFMNQSARGHETFFPQYGFSCQHLLANRILLFFLGGYKQQQWCKHHNVLLLCCQTIDVGNTQYTHPTSETPARSTLTSRRHFGCVYTSRQLAVS